MGPGRLAPQAVGSVVVVLLTVASVLALPPLSDRASAASGKITICHRTHSTTNPYRRITVSQSAVQNARHGGHVAGTGLPAVFDPTYAYEPSRKQWGDIIPGATDGGSAYNGTNAIKLNWTTAGITMFFERCAPMTAREFYDVEIAAGEAPANIVADLNAQEANEDAALRASLPGGTFTLENVASWDTAVSVSTSAPTAVASTSATLHGTITVGSITTVTGFDWATTPTLAGAVSVAATPATVIDRTGAPITATLTGLSPDTTYWFRATGTTNAGAETEGILTGEVLSFTTPPADAGSSTTATSSTSSTVLDTTSTSTTAPETTTSTSTTAPETTTSSTVPDTTSTSTTAPETTTSSTVPETTSTTAPPPTNPSTTTTVPTTTVPTTPPTSAPGGTGAAEPPGDVHGVVWFDRDSDTVRDPGEWVLPGVEVTLVDGPAPAGAATKAGARRRTAVTAADGSYAFTGLPAGDYVATAAAVIQGFDYTSDTDGATDWQVRVEVPARGTGVADFAGLGRGAVVGTMFERSTLRGIPGAAVVCRWGGYDDVLGNDDDVPLPVTAVADGTFTLDGVPYGQYACSGVDAAGRRSATTVLSVMSAAPVRAPLPVDAPQQAPLARTGTDAGPLVLVAVAAMATGTILVGAARRRRLGA